MTDYIPDPDDIALPLVSGWEQHEAMEAEWERERIEDEIAREQALEEWRREKLDY